MKMISNINNKKNGKHVQHNFKNTNILKRNVANRDNQKINSHFQNNILRHNYLISIQ